MSDRHCDLTVEEAARDMSGFDLIALKVAAGKTLSALAEEDLATYAIVWVQECRRLGTEVPWKDVLAMKTGELEDYFHKAVVPDEFAGEVGKDVVPDGPRSDTWPNGAAELDSVPMSSGLLP